MDWDVFSKELHYKYVRFLLKDLSFAESYYLNVLRDGVDEQISKSVDWLSGSRDDLNSLHDKEDWRDYYNDSELERILFTLRSVNENNALRPLLDFYRSGGNLAYTDLGVTDTGFLDSDRMAYDNLSRYVQSVIRSINSEMSKGIVDTVGDCIENNTLDSLGERLVGLNYTPLESRFSVDTRCIFTVKTEYARSVNTGLLQGYSNYGVDLYDWVTSGLGNTCDRCLELESGSPYTLDEVLRNYPVHVNCYMPDTQVFTNNGWKYFYEINSFDKILSLNPKTYITEFIEYDRIIKINNHFGYMYHIYNNWFDMCVTPNHNCFILQRKNVNGVRKYISEFRKPMELNTESYLLRTVENNNVSCDIIDVNGLKFKTNDYIFFMAWYLSEGSVLHNVEDAKKRRYPVYISQLNKETHDLLKKELKRICDYLNIPIFLGKITFEMHSKELYEYLYPLGYSHEKYVPNDLFKLGKGDIQYFLDNYLLGDGYVRKSSNHLVTNGVGRYIFTSSSAMVDSLSYLILLGGYYPSISLHSKKGNVVEHSNGVYVQNHDIYRISVNSSKTTNFSSCKVDKIKYDGVVYCVELPKYHTLWVRRNGKTSWNGNCVCSFKARLDANGGVYRLVGSPVVVDLTPNK